MKYKYVKDLGRNWSNRSKYGHGSTIKSITIHHWGSDGQDHDNVVAWLRGYTGNRDSSAHYVTSAGLVTQIVADANASWHGGNNEANGTSIGIECRPEMSAGDWSTLVQLCADLEEEHGSLKYYRHKDWKNTACPGRYSTRIGELVKAVNAEHKRRKNGTAAPSKPAPTSKPKTGDPFPLDDGHFFYTEDRRAVVHSGFWPEDRAAIRKIQKKVGVSADGRYGTAAKSETKRGVIRWQKRRGIKADGAVGDQTWAEMF